MDSAAFWDVLCYVNTNGTMAQKAMVSLLQRSLEQETLEESASALRLREEERRNSLRFLMSPDMPGNYSGPWECQFWSSDMLED